MAGALSTGPSAVSHRVWTVAVGQPPADEPTGFSAPASGTTMPLGTATFRPLALTSMLLIPMPGGRDRALRSIANDWKSPPAPVANVHE